MFKKLGIMSALLVTCCNAYAHGIYFAERVQETALVYGVGADDLKIVKRLPKISTFESFDEKWHPEDAELKVNGPMVFVEGDHEAVAAVMKNGIWSRTPDGEWIAAGRDEVPNAELSEETIKYAVFLRGPLRKVPKLDSQVLQIIPTGNSFPLLLGKKQTYQVLFKGKPIQGAMVKADFINDTDAEATLSDKNGMVTLPVRNQGLNVVVATFNAPTDRPKIIDKFELLATLSFILPHEPE